MVIHGLNSTNTLSTTAVGTPLSNVINLYSTSYSARNQKNMEVGIV